MLNKQLTFFLRENLQREYLFTLFNSELFTSKYNTYLNVCINIVLLIVSIYDRLTERTRA